MRGVGLLSVTKDGAAGCQSSMTDPLGYPEFNKRWVVAAVCACALIVALPILLDRAGLISLPGYLVYLPLALVAAVAASFGIVAAAFFFRL